MVPVVVYGIDGLKSRMEQQKTTLETIRGCIETINNTIEQTRTIIIDCNRLSRECSIKQHELEEKLIRVLGKLESKSGKSQVIVTNESFVESIVKLQNSISMPTTGLKSRLASVCSAINTFGINIPEQEIELENAEKLLEVSVEIC